MNAPRVVLSYYDRSGRVPLTDSKKLHGTVSLFAKEHGGMTFCFPTQPVGLRFRMLEELKVKREEERLSRVVKAQAEAAAQARYDLGTKAVCVS